jgi:gamma-glutamylcysteine synthetase
MKAAGFILDMNNKQNVMIENFTQRYIDVLSRFAGDGLRSYGFEYEFLSRRPLSLDDMNDMSHFLSDAGFLEDGNEFISGHGIRIAFEPGGQIEYCSPPIVATNDTLFDTVIEFINHTNLHIKNQLGIEYVGTGFIQGRADAPLCLISDRYVKLHKRLSETGTRGLEMMKGTASIHMHVVISGLDELLPLFNTLCQLSISDDFKMSCQRRRIWDNTDPTRCGCPPCCFAKLDTPEELIKRLIRFALDAEVIGEDVSFENSENPSFESFLYHMTTLFTDVRFNLKGPTLELRTLDSMMPDMFKSKWKKFIALLETVK